MNGKTTFCCCLEHSLTKHIFPTNIMQGFIVTAKLNFEWCATRFGNVPYYLRDISFHGMVVIYEMVTQKRLRMRRVK